jgi:2-keto-4-pentenoate hydratase
MEINAAAVGPRRDEDIALDLMKFVAMTTGYGKTTGTGSGVGFQGGGAAAKPEEYAAQLLELYGKCLKAVAGK